MKKNIFLAIFSFLGLVAGFSIGINVVTCPNDRKQILQTVHIHIDPLPDGIDSDYIEKINGEIYANVSNANCFLIFSGSPKIIIVGNSSQNISLDQINETSNIVTRMLSDVES